jgi:putative permease
MQKAIPDNITSALIKAFAIAIGIVGFIWFMYTIISVVLIFLFAIVLATILNAPVTWLEKKKIPRTRATFLVFFLVFLLLGLFTWLIAPMVAGQFKSLIANLPVYIGEIEKIMSSWNARYFHWRQSGGNQSEITPMLPSLTNAIHIIGGYSISLLGSLFLLFVLVSLTTYMVINPRPLLRFYLSLFPNQQRDKAQNAFLKISRMLIGWMRANLIGGAIEGISTLVFLSIMNVPGAWVWGVLALFAQMIPRVGFFLMSVPPTILAFSISPLTAFWVFIFFLVLDGILGDFIMPRLRSSTMDLHPVAIIICLLAMGAAFGFIGILLATPVAAMFKAFYEEFYLSRLKPDEKMEQRIEGMVNRASPVDQGKPKE